MLEKTKFLKHITISAAVLLICQDQVYPEQKASPKQSFLFYSCTLGRAKEPDPVIMKRTLESINRYSQAGNFMLGELRSLYQQLCGEEYTAFLNHIQRPLLSDLMFYNYVAVTVHEEAHYFWHYYYPLKFGKHRKIKEGEFWLEEKERYVSLYLPDKGVLHVPFTQSFPTREAAVSVSDSSIRDDGRFKLYFADEKGRGNSNDLFLLLNEFHAYYQSDATLLQRRKDPANKDKPLHEYLDLGFIQFKFYILHYLIFAEVKHFEVFERLMANTDLRKAFVMLHDTYEKTFNELNPAQQGKRSIRVMWEKRRAFEKLLNSPKYAEMMKRLRG